MYLSISTGFYAKEIGKMAGYNLPLVAVEHQYIVSTSLPELQRLKTEIPVLRHMEASSYIRMERDGLLVGVYEKPEEMKLKLDWMENGVPEGNIVKCSISIIILTLNCVNVIGYSL